MFFFRYVRISLLALACLQCIALDSLVFNVAPGTKIAGGMGKVDYPSAASLTITTLRDAPEWWIVNISPAVDPTVLWNGPTKFHPCKPDNFRTWVYIAVPSKPNAVMRALFPGRLAPCSGGSGGEGEGELPGFEGLIAHVDLDVDSDNDNPAWNLNQRMPSRSDGEDAAEEVGGILNRPGIIICQNAEYDEGDANVEPFRIQDYEKDGIVTSDPDLARAKYTVMGRDGVTTFTYSSAIKFYRGDGTLIPSGAAVSTPQGEYDFLIEGIAPGTTLLTATFIPHSALNKCVDEVKITVFPVFKLKQAAFIPWDWVPSPPAAVVDLPRPFFRIQEGDNRGFFLKSHRFRGQTVAIVTPLELCSPVRSGQRTNLVRDMGLTVEFSPGALDDGILDPVADAEFITRTGLASIDNITATVRRISDREVEVKFIGDITNPITYPAILVPSIDWNYTITINADGQYRLSGSNNGFPSHEVFINNTLVHGYDPGPRPDGYFEIYEQLVDVFIGLGFTIVPAFQVGSVP